MDNILVKQYKTFKILIRLPDYHRKHYKNYGCISLRDKQQTTIRIFPVNILIHARTVRKVAGRFFHFSLTLKKCKCNRTRASLPLALEPHRTVFIVLIILDIFCFENFGLGSIPWKTFERNYIEKISKAVWRSRWTNKIWLEGK